MIKYKYNCINCFYCSFIRDYNHTRESLKITRKFKQMQRILNRQEILNQSIQSKIIHNKLHTTKYF